MQSSLHHLNMRLLCNADASEWGNEVDTRALACHLGRYIVVIGHNFKSPPSLHVFPPTLPSLDTIESPSMVYSSMRTGRGALDAIKFRFPKVLFTPQAIFLVNENNNHYYAAFVESEEALAEAKERVFQMQGACVLRTEV